MCLEESVVHSNLVLTRVWKECIGKLHCSRKWGLFREAQQQRALLSPPTLTLRGRELRKGHRHCSEHVWSPCCTSKELPYLAIQAFHASDPGPLSGLVTNHLSPHSLSGELCFVQVACACTTSLHQDVQGHPLLAFSFSVLRELGRCLCRTVAGLGNGGIADFPGEGSTEVRSLLSDRWSDCSTCGRARRTWLACWDLWTGWSFCLCTGQPAWHWLWQSAMGSTGKPSEPECRKHMCDVPSRSPNKKMWRPCPGVKAHLRASVTVTLWVSGNAVSMLSAYSALKCILLNNRAHPMGWPWCCVSMHTGLQWAYCYDMSTSRIIDTHGERRLSEDIDYRQLQLKAKNLN